MRRDEYYAWSPPELLVENLSKSNRKGNLDELLADYESIGVPEVWLLKMEQRALPVWRLDDGKLREVRTVSEGALAPVRLPQVVVQVEEIWRILDES